MSTDAMHASVTFLTYVQLVSAYQESTAEQDARFQRFLAAIDAAKRAAETGDGLAEAKAEADGCWAEYVAQRDMTQACINELTARAERGDYA